MKDPAQSALQQQYILPFATLDVFTSAPFAGNPLALVRIPASLRNLITQQQKQNIANEFNLSETIFLHEAQGRKHEWEVDIFTTDAELPFDGHPTIGAAIYIFYHLGSQAPVSNAATIFTKAGPVPISRLFADQRVTASIPHDVHIHAHTLGDLLPLPAVKGLSTSPILREAELKAPILSIVKGMTFLLVRLLTLEDLASVDVGGGEVDFHGVLDPEEGWDEGFVAKYYYCILQSEGRVENRNNGVEIKAGNEVGDNEMVRVRSRMIETSMEDPATGSAACALSSYLALEEGASRKFEITQGVEMGRESVIGVEVDIHKEDRIVTHVTLSGKAVVVMEGNLRI